MTLTNKQKRFVYEYLIDSNGTQAAIRAGYSEKTAQEQSSRLLSNVMVQEIINNELDELYKKQKQTLIKGADLAIEALIDAVKNGKGLAKVQAANSILDRAGHKSVDRIQANIKTEQGVNIDEIKSKLIERLNREVSSTSN